MSLIELLVVIAIMGILMTSLIAGYGRFTAQNKVNAALQQINSALHLARNLAIANNRVYHVRIENMDRNTTIDNPDPTDPTLTIPNPNFNRPLDQQFIAINCFPNVARALSVNEVNPAPPLPPVVWNNTNNKSPTLDNTTILYEALPYRIYCGTQFNDSAPPPYDLVLAFLPDGTVWPNSQAMTYFVTDDRKLADDTTLAENDANAYIALQDDRIKLNRAGDFSKGSGTMVRGTVKLLQVYVGGMIKDLPTVDTTNGTTK